MGVSKLILGPALAAMIFCGGCSVVSGTVRDAASGEPLADVRVGVLVLRPGALEAEFQERTRTDGEGRYQITYGAVQPAISFRLEDYRTVTRSDGADPASLDVDMQSIAAIKGVWDVAIAVDGGTMPISTFDFDEEGVRWRAEGSSLGIAGYTFDGTTVVIDGALAHGDAIAGEITAMLALSESGDSLSGAIMFSHVFFDDLACGPDCEGTIKASPAD